MGDGPFLERITLGRMQNPVRGFLHGLAALTSLVGLVVLLIANPGRLSMAVALTVYGASLVLMYSVSTLYHSIPWGENWKRRLRRMDHAAIFLVVAGTYTPVAVVALEGGWRVGSLVVVWTTAVVGVVIKMMEKGVSLTRSISIQMAMGWTVLLGVGEIARRTGWATVWLLFAGGALYTGGMVLFAIKQPRLFPRIFSFHELFHLIVVTASAIHFYTILVHIVPRAV